MYLHVGSGEIVAVEKIVGIFAADGFLDNRKNGPVLGTDSASDPGPEPDAGTVSLLILTDGRVLRSPIAASSLVRRLRSCRTFFDDRP